MNAVRQSLRPKHQILVLKCYPRYQKSQTSVKPNGSELSYLLYYASTRRSKLQKVGAFLEKRTASDVWHQRIGNVQVSLEIVRALIEKCPKDLPLFAGAVLRILRTVLKSGDITMVEETQEVWETFCKVQDPAMLAADQEYIRQYEEVVQLYVNFASKDKPQSTKGVTNLPVSMRFRNVGLEAIKAIADSETITAETARQLNMTVPAVLENIYSTDPTYIHILHQREYKKEQVEKEQAYRRRQSISTVRTADDGEADPIAALGTTADADKLAEQDVGIIALRALRRIFSGNNRGQLRLATSAVLKFMGSHVRPKDHFESPSYFTLGSWPTNLFALLCTWVPVQDRFVILVTAMETLIRSPIVEGDLEKQFVLATVVGWMLSSNINFIGLSVMDVLVGLMQHISLLLQLGGKDSDLKPHHQQADALMSESNVGLKNVSDHPSPTGQHRGSAVVMEIEEKPSENRVKLLNQLLQCIGNLATHVYYTDQIPDMISAIMRRLKPSLQPSPSVTAIAIQDPSGTAHNLARSVSLHEKPGADTFFSFDTARVAALQAVKAIIVVANGRAPDGSSNAAGRSQIGTTVWEGTQWLLRDPNFQVRLAYHDALATWLSLETRKADMKIEDPRPRRIPSQKKAENGAVKEDSLARRAVSNASQREKSPAPKRSTFLDLLHLAIYENAHQFAEAEQDILLLHSLLCILVQRLGVNGVRSGLPMILCLQNEIPIVSPAKARVNIGSLVHGYLWALAVYFDFDASATARTILNEITRRTQNGMWLQSVRVPPILPSQALQAQPTLARTSGTAAEEGTGAAATASAENRFDEDALRPFENRSALVDKIAQGYSMALYSPPSSPPGSPSRSFSVPILAQVGRTRSITHQDAHLRTPSPSRGPPELPPRIRDELLSDWSRERCIANTTKGSSRSITAKSTIDSGRMSANGQNDAVVATVRGKKHLAVGVYPGSANGNGSIHKQNNGAEYLASPRSPHHPATPTHSNKGRRSTSATPSPAPVSTSSVRSAVRVEDLKRVLSGATASGGALRTAWSMRGPTHKWASNRSSLGEGDDVDTGSDSLVSADFSADDGYSVPVSVNVPVPPGVEDVTAAGPEEHRDGEKEEEEQEREVHSGRDDREGSSTPRPTSGHAQSNSQDTIRPMLDRYDGGSVKPASLHSQGDYIPPVPPLPASYQEEQRGRQIDTDTASSIYVTPGESPAPPLSRMETNTSTDTAETAATQNAGQQTPRAQRQSYFDPATAPSLPPPQTTPRVWEATNPDAQTPRAAAQAPSQVVEPSKRRSTSAHNAQAATRKGMGNRSSSSGTPGGYKQNSARQRERESYQQGYISGSNGRGGARDSMRASSGGSYASAGYNSPAADVRTLLEGIEVDSYRYGGDRRGGGGRPPY